MKLKDVLKGRNVVNCKTIEEANRLFDATPQLEAISKLDRQQYNERTVYNPNGFRNGYTYADINYYKGYGYNIIKFSDINEFKEIKIGDHVIVNGERTGIIFNNDEGKIVSIEYDNIGVEFDTKKNSAFHSCSFNGKEDSCWYVDKDMIEVAKKEEEKVVNKFKVGDIIKGKANNERYSWTNKDMTRGEVTKVYNTNEIEVKIIEHIRCNSQIGHKHDVKSDYFELVTPSSSKKSIHITFDGNTTHAIVKEDGKVVKREKVGLFRGDVYDEATGVREVIDKVYGKKVETVNAESKPCKFKVGDKVRILDGSKIDNYEGGWFFSMKNHIGEIVTIDKIINYGKIVSFEECKFLWDVRGIELVNNPHNQISDYTTDELLSEIKHRMEK